MGAVRPNDAQELGNLFLDAAARGSKLELRGGGTKSQIGTPRENVDIVDMTRFNAVIDYDPAELVLTVGAGTPLAAIEALLAAENQVLAFDPFDHGPLFGMPAGHATIGGVIAAGVAGSRRLSAGGARDHLLGFSGVSGRGERFLAGGKVVKNVTGYDLPKLIAGSWGRLAAFTELTLKVLPRPRESITYFYAGCSVQQAIALFSAAMRSRAAISAAAFMQNDLCSGTSLAALRLEGFGPSIEARIKMLETLEADGLDGHQGSPTQSEHFWNSIKTLAPLDDGSPLWRINVPSNASAGLIEALMAQGARYIVDWAGNLVWLSSDAPADRIRTVADHAGGHATLVRADDLIRKMVPALHPQPQGVAALESRVRRAFDPNGIFETGRFGK